VTVSPGDTGRIGPPDPLSARGSCPFASGTCRSSRSAVLAAPVVGSGLSILGRTTRSIAAIRAGCDMDEVTRLDWFEPVPDTAWHDVRVAGSK
jgi:hypothetical protein